MNNKIKTKNDKQKLILPMTIGVCVFLIMSGILIAVLIRLNNSASVNTQVSEKNILLESELSIATEEKDKTVQEVADLKAANTKLQEQYEILENELALALKEKNNIEEVLAEQESQKSEITAPLDANMKDIDKSLLDEIETYIKGLKLYDVDWHTNKFFYLVDQVSYDYTYTDMALIYKDSLEVFEERSNSGEIDWYNEIVDYGTGMLMDAIIPFSSLLLVAMEDEVEQPSIAKDLWPEVSYNIVNGKNVAISQLDFYYEVIEPYYKHWLNGDASPANQQEMIVTFINRYITFYENDLPILSNVYVNNEYIEHTLSMLVWQEDNINFNKAEEEADLQSDIEDVYNTLSYMGDVYTKIKEYQKLLELDE